MNEQDELMKAITKTLETAPTVTVPWDFSARLMTQLPQQPARRRLAMPVLTTRSHYGRLATMLAIGVLLVAMLLVNFFVAPSSTWTLLQSTLFVQFCALLLWLTLAQRHVS